jgi:hypothetical protein
LIFSIFPNLNNCQFQIQLHNPKEQPYHLQLFDSKGVVIVGQFLEDDYFELETILPKGVYWVKAQFYGEVLMEKVVVH